MFEGLHCGFGAGIHVYVPFNLLRGAVVVKAFCIISVATDLGEDKRDGTRLLDVKDF